MTGVILIYNIMRTLDEVKDTVAEDGFPGWELFKGSPVDSFVTKVAIAYAKECGGTVPEEPRVLNLKTLSL